MKQIYILLTGLVVLLFVGLNFFMEDSSNEKVTQKQIIDEKKEVDKSSVAIESTNIIEEISKDSSINEKRELIANIPSYKDIFVEPKRDRLKEVQDEKELAKLEEETQKLIKEADELAAKYNLKVPQYELSKEELEEIKKYKKQIENLRSTIGNEHAN